MPINPDHGKTLVRHGCIRELTETLQAIGSEKALIVCDDNVYNLYSRKLSDILKNRSFQFFRFPVGEKAKNRITLFQILDSMEDYQMTRTDAVIAFGGGVTGDLAGLAASLYLRGIPLIQVPTSLLAMVDSSIGGKNGIDSNGRKNRIGSFYNPAATLCDPDLLGTLPEREWLNGIGEMLKTGMLFDEGLFTEMLTPEWREKPEAPIQACVRYKLAVVQEDPEDWGKRRLLNLGHTFAHAIESVNVFRVPHGLAVGIGLLCAARTARALGLCDDSIPQKVKSALEANGMPSRHGLQADRLIEAASDDKKRTGSRMSLVLPRRIGECEIITDCTENVLSWMKLGLEE